MFVAFRVLITANEKKYITAIYFPVKYFLSQRYTFLDYFLRLRYKVGMSSQTLTPAEVAERYDVSAITVRLWCRRGFFPNAVATDTPRGPFWTIPESDLKGFSPPPMGRPPKAKPGPASGQDGRVIVTKKRGKK